MSWGKIERIGIDVKLAIAPAASTTSRATACVGRRPLHGSDIEHEVR
jgi:hypothetical protein